MKKQEKWEKCEYGISKMVINLNTGQNEITILEFDATCIYFKDLQLICSNQYGLHKSIGETLFILFYLPLKTMFYKAILINLTNMVS